MAFPYAGQSDEALPDISLLTLNSAADGPGNAGDVVDVNTVDQGDCFLRGLFIFGVVLCRCVYGLVVYLKSSKA